MKRCFAFVLIAIAFGAQDGFGLSETLHTPKIFWPKNYDTNKAEQVHRVLNSTNFHYLEGMTSYWEPKWSTTLVIRRRCKDSLGIHHSLKCYQRH